MAIGRALNMRHGKCQDGRHYISVSITGTEETTGAIPLGEVSHHPGKLIQMLGDIGVVIGRKLLMADVERVAAEKPTFEVATTLGWHRGRDFILGKRVFRPSSDGDQPPIEVAL